MPRVLLAPGRAVLSCVAPDKAVPAVLAALTAALGARETVPVLQALQPPPSASGKFDTLGIAAAVAGHIPAQATAVDESITGSLPAQQMSIGSAPHDNVQVCGGAIGNGLPLAVGVTSGAPGCKAISLEGDGSAMFAIQSLWTMASEQLDVITVICANRSYAILKFGFARMGGGLQGPKARSMLAIGEPTMDL
jgi:acetolactate synthase-1/2/3 large subunit